MPRALKLKPALTARPASQVVPQSVAWLWPGRLALGKLAMLDADPGMGKSILTLELCARLSAGRPFPDGSPVPGPCSSLLLNAEDSDHDTVLPRLRALGADLDRVFLQPREDPDTGMPLRIPTQVGVLAQNIARTGARLVVIDPVVAFLAPSVNNSNDQSVRQALYPLARLAEARQCAILMVRHLTKRGGTTSLYRGGGSIGFVGACRSVWLLARDLEDPQRRVLAQVKNNLAPPQPSLAFSLPEAPATSTGESNTDLSRVVPAPYLPTGLVWHGTSRWSADELLGGALSSAGLTGELVRAKDCLTAMLENGPRTTRDLWKQAQAQGISDRTLHRAKEKMPVRVRRVWEGGQFLSYWSLVKPGDEAPAEPGDVDPWLQRLRKIVGPATPLDDL